MPNFSAKLIFYHLHENRDPNGIFNIGKVDYNHPGTGYLYHSSTVLHNELFQNNLQPKSSWSFKDSYCENWTTENKVSYIALNYKKSI